MARPFTSKVLTANRLLEGDVVYYAPDGTWALKMRNALLIDDEDQANRLLGEAKAIPHILVGAYLADAQRVDGHPAPTHFREDFRRTGPSNYAHGKQSEV